MTAIKINISKINKNNKRLKQSVFNIKLPITTISII